MRFPMFPLGNVALPGELVPLTVFEPRYRRLVLDCLAAESPAFGTALIERGHEVGGGDQRASIGTAAVIRTVAPLGQGRFNLVAAGVRRITVLEWLADDPYPRADVEDWPDAAVEPGDERAAVAASVAELAGRVPAVVTLAARVAAAAPARPRPLELSEDLTVASYQLAAAVPLGPADRFRVLQAPSIAARLAILRHAFDDVEAGLRFRLGENDQTGRT